MKRSAAFLAPLRHAVRVTWREAVRYATAFGLLAASLAWTFTGSNGFSMDQMFMRDAKGLDWLAADWHDASDRREIKRQTAHALTLGYSSLESMLENGEPLLHSTVTENIQSSGGDRTSVSLFESNIPTNPTESYVGNVNEAAWNFQTNTVTFNVSNSNAVEIKVTATEALRFYNDANWPTAVDSAEQQGCYYAGSLAVETNNCTFEYIEHSDTGFGYAVRCDNSNADQTTIRYFWAHGDNVADVRFWRSNNDNDVTWGTNILTTIHNCLAYYHRRSIWVVDQPTEIYNVSVALRVGSATNAFLCQDAGNNSNWVASILVNCVGIGFHTDFHANTAGDIDTTNSDNLVAGDTTASTYAATNSFDSVAATTFWTDPTAAGLDFTPKTGTTYAGSSGHGFTDDIAATARTEYTIGCIEFPGGGGGGIVVLRRRRSC